jgi:CBS domain-containing protein/uncharacterized protein (DUF2267 family)
MAEPITNFIRRKVVVLHEDQPVLAAARAMCGNRIGSIVVSDGRGHMVGMLTDRDIACALVSRGLPHETPIRDVMSREISFVSEAATVDNVIEIMKANGVRRIPVIRETKGNVQQCLGLVSLDDLIASQQIPYDDVARIVRAQIIRRATTIPRWDERTVHATQASDRFFHSFEAASGLSEPRALLVASVVFGLIVRRLHYTDASLLISKLPRNLQSELEDLPAGPDASISGEAIMRELVSRFDFDRGEARRILGDLKTALGKTIGDIEAAELVNGLPGDIQTIFANLYEGKENVMELR